MTFAVAVAEPDALDAVKVYVVVAAGLTLVEPLAEVDVNVPGVITILVAPVVTQLNPLIEPELVLIGLAVNEFMVGFDGMVTVTVAVAVVEPDGFVAVSV